jgi:hypothetical protein
LVAHLFSILTTVRHLVYRRSRVQFPARPIFLSFFLPGPLWQNSRVAFGWPIAKRCMHRVERDVMSLQKYEKSLLHFLQVPLDSYSTYSLRFDVGGSSSPLSYSVATIVIKIFIHTNHTSTNVFIKKEVILF